MKFKVSAGLKYEVQSSSTFILNIHALRTPRQTVVDETFTIQPYVKAEELVSVSGENRFVRLDVPITGPISIQYEATVDNAYKVVDCTGVAEDPVSRLDPGVLVYLNPSRYCQSDKLYRLANNTFGKIENPFEKVFAITEWIHKNVEYLSGFTNSQTSAYDTVTEQAGVCRDFAHLGIALCRALTIPARYFTGFAYRLKPADFHACFEAYIGGEWILFDATKLSQLNGLVKIATGRDAADTAIASIFGDVYCTYIKVDCEMADEHPAEPFIYDASSCKGISYL
jgi:transglutaminase-like putative cysteine protease